MTTSVETFWQGYLATLPDDHTHQTTTYTAWGFGDGAQMADELGALVVAGTKTATASARQVYQIEGEPLPAVGDLSVILDGRGAPLCLIETTEVTVKPFNEVDPQFAYDEGEGDRSLAFWREAHRQFFSREAAAGGWTFSEDMAVVLERFRVLYRPSTTK